MSWQDLRSRGWTYCTGTTAGAYSYGDSITERRCNCSIKYGPGSDTSANTIYVALCEAHVYSTNWDYGSWVMTNSSTCPKGWGRFQVRYPNHDYTVKNAQGYVKNGTPIYSTVTKYRDTVYNYTAGRIAKA